MLTKLVVSFTSAPKERLDNVEHLRNAHNCIVYLGGTNYTENMCNALEEHSDEDIIYLEDDVILCDNFDNLVTKAIEKYPNKLIQFFSQTRTNIKPEEYYIGNFTDCQCLYIPKEINKLIRDNKSLFMKNFKPEYKYNNTEMLISSADSIRTFIGYTPCLVQQYPYKSTIVEGWVDKPTKLFIEDMNDSSK